MKRAGSRTNEIGVRVLAGLAASAVLTGSLTRLLYGVGPHDAPTMVAAALLLAAAGALAGYLPARRATRVDPMTALRCD